MKPMRRLTPPAAVLALTLTSAGTAAAPPPFTASGAGPDAGGAPPLQLAQAGTPAPQVRVPKEEPRPRQVYRWTDESGETHFGYYKPRGQEAEAVGIRLPAGPAAAPAPEGGTEGEAEPQGEAEAKRELSEDEKDLYSANCKIARQNLKTLDREPDQVLERDEEGNLVPVNADQYNARREQARKNVERFCR